MRLQLCTWSMVEEYLDNSQTVIIPIGSTEQHGPNGYIGTDAICPEVVAEGVGEAKNLLVAPTIQVGMAQHHMRFPGSMTLRPSTLMALIVDTIESLAVHGFEHLYFLNGHGGNIATVRAAFAEYHANGSLNREVQTETVQTHLFSWWQGQRVGDYSQTHFADAEGSHATPTEVSLTYHAYPPTFNTTDFEPRIAPRGHFFGADDYRTRFPDGRIGSDPALATAAHGAQIYQAAVDDVIDHLATLSI